MKRIFSLLGVFLILYIAGTVIINLPGKTSSQEENVNFQAPTPSNSEATGKVSINDVAVGSGEKASTGDTVSVLYTGKLSDGTIFDSNTNRESPFSFKLGAGEVIQGWEEGIDGMKVGGKRTLTIPPELAYGNQQMGNIPPNSTLVFEVELLDVQKDTQNNVPQPSLNF